MTPELGNYTIGQEIGRGGMATVYSAVQESLNRVVALKELDLSGLRSEPAALERFRLEARAAAALDHPGIVTIYDFWEEEGKAYIAMEMVDGVELADALRNLGCIPYLNALIIATAVSEALHYAHSRGMVHRDVKPGNIMLSSGGEIRLMDFGIVSVSGTGDLTMAGQILGTPAYMAPEQIAGEEPGARADLFSLGAVLYEMIAGRKPFTGASHVAVIQSVLHGQPTPLRDADPQVPEAISQAVRKCLEKNPESRFGSVEEFSTVLEMLMPLDRPSRADVVRRLVHGTREQERTRLHTSAGEDDRTHAMAGSPGVPGETVRQTAAGAKDTPWPGEQNPVPGAGTTLYELEKGPPAELPPLQPGDEASTRAQVQTSSRKTPPAPLALKDVPELDPEQDTGKYIDQTKRRPRRSFLWILPVALLAAGAFLVFYGGPGGQGLLKKAAIPVSDAHITIAADPGGSVFMDGVPVGSADPSLFFDVKPGLHTLEVRHPRFGPRKFIVELEPGEAKEIVVTFNER